VSLSTNPPRRRALSAAARIVPVLLLLAAAGADAAPPRVPDRDAYRHIGKEVTVCGHVAGATWMEGLRGRPTFLNLGGVYPNQTFTVVIWDDARGKFDTPPNVLFDGADICVTGKVETYKGKPQIVVRGPQQITVESVAAFPADRFSDEERLVLKSVLAALGYATDEGSPAWDDEAAAALRAFQEASGMGGDGARDPGTLRKLAEAVPSLSDDAKTRILRLLLLNLAQRES
jgi:hypothetical protein